MPRSRGERYLKLVMKGAEFWGDIETDVPYTTDELEQICVWASVSGKGSKVSGNFSKGRKLVIFKGTGGTGASSSDSIQKPQDSRFRQCDVCKLWNSCRTRWCAGCMNKVYCGTVCQKQDWPVHRGSCKCARRKSKGSVPGKQRSNITTLEELRDIKTFFSFEGRK